MSDNSLLYSDKVATLFDLLSFCKRHYCEENIMFLLDAERLDALKTDTERQNMLRRMFKKYFTKGEQYELNLSSKQNERVTSAFEEKHLMEQIRAIGEIAHAVRYMIQHDIVPRYKQVSTRTL